jgi:hypothetical protein
MSRQGPDNTSKQHPSSAGNDSTSELHRAARHDVQKKPAARATLCFVAPHDQAGAAMHGDRSKGQATAIVHAGTIRCAVCDCALSCSG